MNFPGKWGWINLGSSQRLHTLFRNSCRDADGATTEAEVVAGVWSDYTDRVVTRADDDVQLTYYASWVCGNITTNALLSAGDGQCGAWVKLFLDMLRAHGIDYANEFITIRYSNPDFPSVSDRGFLVKEWSFAGGGISGHTELRYLNIPPVSPSPLIVNNTYVWRFEEATEAPGVPGQGTANPASLFGNHQVARINGVYYDPSYGKTYNSLGQFDDEAVAGHYAIPASNDPWPVNEQQVNLDLDGNGQIEDVLVDIQSPDIVFLIQDNPTGNQLEETPSDYPFPP